MSRCSAPVGPVCVDKDEASVWVLVVDPLRLTFVDAAESPRGLHAPRAYVTDVPMAVEHGVIKQIAYVVDDLDAAIARWVEIVHAGPFFRIDNARIEDLRYRGQPADAVLSLAVGNSGGIQIELIQLMDDAPSVYRELPRGVHHLALLARDFEAESTRLERLGHPLAWSLTLPGVCRVRYHDTLASFGHFVELWESTESMRGLLEMVETAARDWDGRDPVRRISL